LRFDILASAIKNRQINFLIIVQFIYSVTSVITNEGKRADETDVVILVV